MPLQIGRSAKFSCYREKDHLLFRLNDLLPETILLNPIYWFPEKEHINVVGLSFPAFSV
jgi:hypothetical protein